MNPETTENNWDNKWNQTTDLAVPDDANCYVIAEDAWDKGNGEWILYNPVNPTEPSSTEVTETSTSTSASEESTYASSTTVTEPSESSSTTVTEPSETSTTAYTDPTEYSTSSSHSVNDGLTINAVSSNDLFKAETKTIGAYDSTVTVTYELQTAINVLNAQWMLTYNPSKLQLLTVDEADFTPNMTDSCIGTGVVDGVGIVKGNCSNLSTYDFTTSKVFVQAEFLVLSNIESVDVKLDVQYLSLAYYESADTEPVRTHLVKDSALVDLSTVEGSVTTESSVVTEPSESSEPVSSEPVTSEPVTNPSDTYTLYFAAPVFKEGTTWDDVYFTYSATSNRSTATRLPMTRTNNMYYVSGDIAGSLSTNSNWAVYEIQLTAEQAAEVDACNYAGFTNYSNNISTLYKYANSIFRANLDETGYVAAKKSVADLNGKMFVINGATSLTTKTAFTGNWVSNTGSEIVSTIYAASPVVSETASMGDVYFRYSSNSTVSSAAQIRMMKTDYLYTNTVSASNLMAGDWTIYKLQLTAEQVAAIDASTYTGFTSPYGAEIRTSFTYSNSVTRAKIGSYSSTYNSKAASVSELNGKTFIIQDSVNDKTTYYLGYWSDDFGHIKTVTIKVAVPTIVNDKEVTSLDLVYSNEYDVKAATHIAMTKTDEEFTPDAVYTSLISDSADWAVYEVTVDANQIKDIESCYRMGFVANDQVLKTNYSWSGNVLRAGIGEYESTYDTTTTSSLYDLDGATFVVCGAYNDKALVMNGYWVLA